MKLLLLRTCHLTLPLLLLFSFSNVIRGQVLTPPYFNLVQGRRIEATATCGEGVPEPELYCKLVGPDTEKELNYNEVIIQGQFCDHCDPNNPEKRHPADYAVDGRETRWQSPPLSRGLNYNEVNLTIDLGQEFHVAYVILKMGNSPRPGVWALERSIDKGQTFHPWQYFATTPGECQRFFGRDVQFIITADDSVICNTQYSKIVPLEGGEVFVPLVQDRPSAQDFFNSTVLQEWTRATNVRFRLLRVNNLLGHLMSLANRDTSTTRRYFYSIKDISIGGRCRCNGHADTCTSLVENDPYHLVCDCKDQTCGNNCEVCCPGFEQKKWSQSKNNRKFACEPCNCFGHSTQCVYNETVDALKLSLDIHKEFDGGGVCQNCQHHTEGINCNKCAHGYYRPRGKALDEPDVCEKCVCDLTYSTGNCEDETGKCECKPEFTKPNCDSCSFGYHGYPLCRPCDCYINGTTSHICDPLNGTCPCKINYGGQYCRFCAEGYYDYPECKTCECHEKGSISNVCDGNTGQCKCMNSFGGKNCNQCSDGYYNFPRCTYCNCDIKGTLPEVCDKNNGQCTCKAGYGGPRCDQCIASYTGFPDCRPCNCSTVGSVLSVCDVIGKCTCLPNFGGKQCDQCSPGFFQYPNCTACNCDSAGTHGITCNNDGSCVCKENFGGEKCNECKKGYYNYPVCEECNYNPAGVISTFTGCNTLKPGELINLQCKENVRGKQCNDCKERFWNLQPSNPFGCEDCVCNLDGTIDGLSACNSKTGQCYCKPSVTAKQCDQCADGYYNLTGGNFFGCTDCDCDIGGAVSNTCNRNTGQCNCLPRVTGRSCNKALVLHYFPTLHQYQYEIEEGQTPGLSANGNPNPVRYGFEDKIFPGYSWKGYAVFSPLQNETNHNIFVDKPSVYRMILRYINPNSISVSGSISAVPEYTNNLNEEQKFQVLFKPTRNPTFVTVAGILGNNPSPFVLNPGGWIVKIKIEKSLFLDYFVLMPAEYYEASLLISNVTKPCTIDKADICRHYMYPNVSSFDSVRAAGGYVVNGAVRSPIQQYFSDYQSSGAARIPLLSTEQPSLSVDMTVTRPGSYVFVVFYATTKDHNNTPIQVTIRTQKSSNKGALNIYNCRYTSLCRQVLLDKTGQVAIYNLDSNFISIIFTGTGDGIGVDSVIAIPIDQWSLGYVQPTPACLMKDNACINTILSNPADAKIIDFKSGNENHVTKILPSTIMDDSIELVLLNSNTNMIDLKGKVPKPGPYIFVVHYYQPDHPAFEVDILIQDGIFYEAKLPVQHCPSNIGCRSVVRQANGNRIFSLPENFVFSVKEPNGKNIWLQHLLAIPSSEYSDATTTELPFDQTAHFISVCGGDSFNLDTSAKDFCRNATFSLTTKYNHGTLACSCDFQGSVSFECAEFGGQCPCRPNVIGRKCEICKTKYFGFPDCQPCSCPPQSLCDPFSGVCICPSNVLGEKCDRCKPYTYGLDPVGLHGCFDCACNYEGVRNNNVQCNLQTGACDCKDNIEGRTCDHCVAGHWQFPYCTPCECDLRGTTIEICNQANAECLCKPNVHGPACDVCKDDTYNLQPDNPEGCAKCFCFGKTSRCSSSTLFISSISAVDDWKLANVNVGKSVEVTNLSTTVDKIEEGVEVNLGFVLDGGVTYFVAPQQFLGNKLTSYGNNLNYTLHYTAFSNGASIANADVILYGANTYLFFESVDAPTDSTYFSTFVRIVENNFLTQSGSIVTREEFMQVLQNLTAIYIKATYSSMSQVTKLLNVVLEVGVHEYSLNTNLALAVEQCHCPPNYVGLSCEDCADGYYRLPTGPFGGYCVPCQCNGHADTCDKATGLCHKCKHNTKGDHCEKCEVGYYGNATYGTPSDCLICACPLPIPSNNFATGCEIVDQGDRITCDCKPGYTGDRCEMCAPGFYGRPESAGEVCVPCQCHGNANLSESGSCDPVTGRCLRCLHNTSGDSCERCAPGFYGDAVGAKNCQPCDCDTCGTKECDHKTGNCDCQSNVIGEKCDRCAGNHFGFTTCQGCFPCNCEVASESQQCDDLTGHCRCKPGVTGQICDRCSPGFWKYTPEGCTSCGCNSEYSVGVGCNVNTGTCECLPGVIGDKCNTCPHRWVLVPDQGCFGCDKCIDGLLDVTDTINADFSPLFSQFQTASIAYLTIQRLKFINGTANKYALNVSDIVTHQIDLSPFNRNISEVQNEADGALRNVKQIYGDALKAAKTGGPTHEMAYDLEAEINKVIEEVRVTVMEVNSLGYNLETGAVRRVDYALKEAQNILNDIYDMDIDEEKEREIKEVLDKAINTSVSVMKFAEPLNTTIETLERVTQKHKSVDHKLDELDDYGDKARKAATEATGLNQMDKKAKIHDKVHQVKMITTDVENRIKDLPDLSQNASEFLQRGQEDLWKLVESKKALSGGKIKTDQTVSALQIELDNAREQVRNAQKHADELRRQAYILETSAKMPVQADLAVNAANSYEDISSNIDKALMNITKANSDANEAANKLRGIEDKLQSAQKVSFSRLDEARHALEVVQQNLSPELNAGVQILNSSTQSVNQTGTHLESIKKQLKTLQGQGSTVSKLRNLDPDTVIERSKQVTSEANIVGEKLPEMTNRTVKVIQDLNDKRKASQDVDSFVAQFNEKVPTIQNQAGTVKNKPIVQNDSLKILTADLDALKKTLLRARDIASKIKVGVKLSSKTSLELPIPASLLDEGSSTDISLYFKTVQPNSLLFYLGNEGPNKREKRDVMRKPKSDDFLALMLVNGYPQLKLSLGERPVASIVINKTVTQNQWHGINIQRTNKVLNLTLTDYNGVKYTTKGESLGLQFVLNLDKEQSKLYFGGIPDSFVAPREVEYTTFTGEFQDLSINGEPIGFWNFANISVPSGYHISGVINGSIERKELKEQTQSTASRFSGDGYAKIRVGNYLDQTKDTISLSFKTTALNGLLFLATNGKKYIAIQIYSGFIYFKFDMGKGGVLLRSRSTYSDSEWHRITAKRAGSNGVLTVDQETVKEDGKANQEVYFELPDFLYLAGFDGDHKLPEVLKVPFEGCLDAIQIGGQSVTVDNINAYKALPGCPVKFSNFVSFEEKNRGYVAWPDPQMSISWSSPYNMELALRIKTRENRGLIAFGTDGTNKFVLQLVNNTLVFKSGSQEVRSNANIKYNDDRWHSIMAINEPNALHLIIDDFEILKSSGPARSTQFSPKGRFYFGTVPANVENVLAFDPPFDGCIGDVTVNGVIVNFENIWEANAATIGQCSGPAKNIRAKSAEKTIESKPVTPIPSVTSESTPAAPVTVAPGSLPLVPAVDPDLNEDSGIRFGTTKISSLMYDFDPTQFSQGLSIKVDVKTVKADGIIFYVTHPEVDDFVSLYLKESNLNLKYRCGDYSNTLSQPMVNQAEWHTVKFEITYRGAKLSTSINEQEKSDRIGCNSINLISPYFVGGFENLNMFKSVQQKLGFNKTFVGCLRKFEATGRYVKEPRSQGVIPCSSKVEEGTFFSIDSYIKIDDNFKVGKTVDIKLTFKPRDLNALLVAVHSRKDFLILQLIDGSIKFTVDNGNGPYTSSYSPRSKNYFLDNTFHTISAIKQKNVIILTVDGVSSPPSFDFGGSSTTTDTNNPLYVGGYPSTLIGSKGIETNSHFVGCISSFEINGKPVNLASSTPSGNVMLNVCPTI